MTALRLLFALWSSDAPPPSPCQQGKTVVTYTIGDGAAARIESVILCLSGPPTEPDRAPVPKPSVRPKR